MLLLIALISVALTLVLNSFVEWLVHGPIMHSKWALPYLRKTHEEHHQFFAVGGEGYKNHSHGSNVNLPWWSMFFTVAPTAVFGWAVSRFAEMPIIFWCVTFTSVFYYYACHHANGDEEFEKFFHI